MCAANKEREGGPLASTYVAVAASEATIRNAADATQTTEREGLGVRIQDKAQTHAVRVLPCMLALAASVVTGGVYGLSTRAMLLWSLVTTVLWLTWMVASWCLRSRAQRLIDPMGVAAFGALAVLPWLALGAPQRWLCEGLLIGFSLAAACALSPLRRAAVIAALLPLSLAGAEALPFASDPSQVAATVLAGVVLAGTGVWLALVGHRMWRGDARALIDRDDHLCAVKAERDEALRADRDKSRFLANASHDLRQPVHAIGLFAATLEKRLRGTPEEPLVRNVIHSIEGLERSFSAMLDISRLDAGTVEPNFQHFPLRDVFRRLHMQFAGQAELAGLCLRFSPGGKFVSSDPQLLERILVNLVQNALKYTLKGGVVVVARTAAARVNIEIWDTGAGMQAADLPRVFDEFYQVARSERARGQGLGMGLAIVKRLAQLLGHRLTVVSRPGKGTMFRLGIALGGLADVGDATMAADTLPMPVSEPRTVMVVEDEEPIREGLRGLLEEWGYVAVVVASTSQAEHAAQTMESPPDLILSDLHLGDGPDGIAAIAAVRRRCGHHVPAILVTGDTSHEEVRRATDSGYPVLFKPVQPRRLFNALREFVS